jgi:hypothetical protein
MTGGEFLFITFLRILPFVALLGVVTAAIALALTLAGPQQRRLARLLWPLAALLIWTSACLLLGFAFASDPENMDSATAMRRLVGPLPVLLLGDALWLVWLWHVIKARRGETREAEVSA